MPDAESNSQTMMWVALLTTCETANDLRGQSDEAIICAQQMRDTGNLEEVEDNVFMLTSKGHRLLLLVESLRNYSLGLH